jgi:hypothetical protein
MKESYALRVPTTEAFDVGRAVAITANNNFAVAATLYTKPAGKQAQVVYIFRIFQGSAVKINMITSSTDYFAESLAAISSGYLFIGSYRASSQDSKEVVHVYNESGLVEYTLLQAVSPSDGDIYGNRFGYSLAATSNGNLLVVGAPYDSPGASTTSTLDAAFVFERASNGTFVELAKLVANDGAPSDLFGHSVAVSPSGTILVGAPSGDSPARANVGSVYVFQLVNSPLLPIPAVLRTELVGAANPYSLGQFGWSVAITDADSIAIADPGWAVLVSNSYYAYPGQLEVWQ